MMRSFTNSGRSAVTQVKVVQPRDWHLAMGQGLLCPEASIVAGVIRRVCHGYRQILVGSYDRLGDLEEPRIQREGRKAHTFAFLGFTHYCGLSRQGRFLLGRKTSGKKFRQGCRRMDLWLKQVRPLPMKHWWPQLAAKLRGHYQYYGVSGNSRMMAKFGYVTMRALHQWLNRRSQCKSFTWQPLTDYLAHYPLPHRRLVHNLYQPSPWRETG